MGALRASMAKLPIEPTDKLDSTISSIQDSQAKVQRALDDFRPAVTDASVATTVKTSFAQYVQLGAQIESERARLRAAIGQIAAIIDQVNSYTSTIAAAVEEQTVTTSEMNRNVAEAATGSGQIADDITGVASAAATSTEVAQGVHRQVTDLARIAAELRTDMNQFTY